MGARDDPDGQHTPRCPDKALATPSNVDHRSAKTASGENSSNASIDEDVVRGVQHFPAGTLGDFVLERSDGVPTYLFASAVDDLEMEITHVVRGEEHVPNTARQLAVLDRLTDSELSTIIEKAGAIIQQRSKQLPASGKVPERT